ncbi:MAG: DUF1667 domain-containing protein [Clostridia bacterium]|nr:DUF1667 domain-containing protein [Clostridia bacterium]
MKQVELTCICCPMGCNLRVELDGGSIASVTGNTCKRGDAYARQECIAPVRVITASVPVVGGKLARVSVKTAAPVPKNRIFDVMDAIRLISAQAPVRIGDVLCENIANTGANLVATRSAERN